MREEVEKTCYKYVSPADLCRVASPWERRDVSCPRKIAILVVLIELLSRERQGASSFSTTLLVNRVF